MKRALPINLPVDLPIEQVSALLHEAAETLVLPRFDHLADHEIERKPSVGDPDDLVTVVDHEVETFLSNALPSLAAAAVLGEEATHHRPERIGLISTDEPLWIIDPIDGTKNFAAGEDGFGIMVAYVVGGEARAAWILLPARRQLFVAEQGAGATLNGAPIRTGPAPDDAPPRGVVMTRYMPNGLGDSVMRALESCHQHVAPSGCAAIEYTDILAGRREFVIYYRLLPWDHAAPALILTEAGGCVRHVGGRAYSLRSESQLTVVACDRPTSDTILDRVSPALLRTEG